MSLPVLISSFGFKHGPPPDAALVLDVRFLPNPYYVPDLRPRSGRDPATAAHVFQDGRADDLLDRLLPLVEFLLPQYAAAGRECLHLAVGCTGGRHRSVAVAEALARLLVGRGLEARVEHRHLGVEEAEDSW